MINRLEEFRKQAIEQTNVRLEKFREQAVEQTNVRLEKFRKQVAYCNKERESFYVMHFKGGWYRVLNIAKDCEDITREVVVYQNVFDKTVYIRNLEDFIGTHPKSELDNKYRLKFDYEFKEYSEALQLLFKYAKTREELDV